MVCVKRLICICAIASLSACSSASHIPPPWELPGAAAGSVIENARYKARRDKVKAFVARNYEALARDITGGGGPSLTEAMALARIPDAERASFLDAVNQTPDIYFEGPIEDRIENLTVALMVHGDI